MGGSQPPQEVITLAVLRQLCRLSMGCAVKISLLQLHVRDGARNIAKIQEGLGELEGKLTYEKEKLQGYTADLNEAEKRQEPHIAHGCLPLYSDK